MNRSFLHHPPPVGVGSSPGTRLATMDVAKGILIIAIILDHVLFLRDSSEDIGSMPPLMQVPVLGLMLFFMISGYFYRPDRGFVQNMRKRMPALLISYAIAALLLPTMLYAYMAVLGGHSLSPDSLFECYLSFMSIGSYGAPFDDWAGTIPVMAVHCGWYFLTIIALCCPVLYAVGPRIYGDVGRTAAAVFAGVAVTAVLMEVLDSRLPCRLEMVPLSVQFMFLGMELGRRRAVERMEGQDIGDHRLWINIVVPLAAGTALCFISNPEQKFNLNYFGQYGGWSAFPFFAEAALVCFSMLGIISLLARCKPLVRAISAPGRHTLAVLLYHMFFLRFALAPFFEFPDKRWLPDISLGAAVVLGFAVLLSITVLAQNQKRIIGGVIARLHPVPPDLEQERPDSKN